MINEKPHKPNVPASGADGIEPTAQSMFGPPPLVAGEDPAAYNELHARISTAVKPKDFLEEIWVRDVVDLSREVLRMRRLKAKLMTSAVSENLQPRLKKSAQKLSTRWAAGDPAAIAQVDKQLASKGWTIEAITADTFFEHIENIERVDRMIMHTETRRNLALREVEHHRASIAEALRRASDEVVEAEFEDVAPDQIARRKVA